MHPSSYKIQNSDQVLKLSQPHTTTAHYTSPYLFQILIYSARVSVSVKAETVLV